MIIIQFQVTNTDRDELQHVVPFCNWLINDIIIYNILKNSNEEKIKIRINKLQDVRWINWKKNKKIKLDYDEILDIILKCIKVNKYKNNVYKIETNESVKIPGTHTSVDRLIRYINAGDIDTPATNIFTNIQKDLNYTQLNSYWKFYISNELGYFTESKLITQIS